MRKALILLILALAMAGCAGKERQKYLNVELRGNPTTGYDWNGVVSDDAVISLTGDDYISDSSLRGSGGTYLWTYTALKEGTATIEYKYARGWEKTDADQKASVEISVDKDLNITVVSASGPDKMSAEAAKRAVSDSLKR